MSNIRVIRSIKNDVAAAIPNGALAFGDGYIDYVADGTPDAIPVDAVYAAHLDDAGVFHVIVQAPAAFTFSHHFSGWDESTWPPPVL